ncbi:methyl-accepting chemotaxis protein [Wukongibacter baidiensis]|uniref:methyl-accepting chemotaxis protein n=1 Tax=Wukongibacter baidiensis TaxID=1723361 RepID=UPI003D7FA0F1
MKLRSKVLIPIVLTVIILMTILVAYSYRSIKNNLVLSMIESQLSSELTTVVNTVQSRENMMEITKEALNEKAIALTKSVAQLIKENPELLSTENMVKLAQQLGVQEIHVVDGDGVLRYGTVPDFFGFDFKTSDQTKPFLKILENSTLTLAQEPTPRGSDKKLFQYIGAGRIDEPGIVQVGLEPKAIEDLMKGMDIQNLVEKIRVGKSGYAYVINNDGEIIAHPNKEQLGINIKEFEWSKDILGKEEGKIAYTYEDITKHASFKSIGNKVVVVTFPEDEVKATFVKLAKEILVGLLAITLALLIVVTLLIDKLAVKPIKNLVTVMDKAGSGDLSVRFDVKTKDEIGLLGVNFNKMIENMKEMTIKIKDTVSELTDFSERISSSSEDVSISSEEIARTIQEVALGASNLAEETSMSLEVTNDLAENIQNVTEKLKITEDNNDNMKKKNELGITTITELGEQFEKNSQAAMKVGQGVNELAEKSKSIGGILEAINSIAEQTNLLALNAAIEAARAGEHGKGFAVVAEEVRKLAEESAKATNEIQNIIDEITIIIEKTNTDMSSAVVIVENANNLMADTKSVFEEITIAIDESIKLVNSVNEDVNEINDAKDNTQKSIENVSAVAQQSAASTEEISASTEEQTASMEEITASIQSFENMIKALSELIKVYKV